ncbi:MAG: hypothetical protein R2826_02650 [Thermoleophilia bacterium]
MKRWMVLVAVVLIALAIAAPFSPAAGKSKGKAQGKVKFELVGTVKAVAGGVDDGSLTVIVKSGTKTVNALRGKELAMTVDPKAKIRLVTDEGAVDADLADIPLDAKVKVRGRIEKQEGDDAATYIATFIKAKPVAAATAK